MNLLVEYPEAPDPRQRFVQGHSWGMANITRDPSSPTTWLIEASVAPAGDDGRRLLQVCNQYYPVTKLASGMRALQCVSSLTQRQSGIAEQWKKCDGARSDERGAPQL